MSETGYKDKDQTRHEQDTEQSMLHGADTMVDRSLVEQHARDLLEHATGGNTEYGYKTEKTYCDDARTALFEALTASGHLSRVELEGSLSEIHSRMLYVLLNAYDDSLPDHERERQFQELCEELTRQEIERSIAQGEAPLSLQVATISDAPTLAGMSRTIAESLGYRPQNHKGMIRSSKLIKRDDGVYIRVMEQISRSNADPVISSRFLSVQNVPLRLDRHADTRVLGTQLLHEHEQGVVGIVRRLDQFDGSNIRYGEQASPLQIPYDQLREESAQREQQAEAFVAELGIYMQKLDTHERAGIITRLEHTELLQIEIHRILQAICVMRPEYAADCFGAKSVHTYNMAANQAAQGDVSGSTATVERGQHNEQTITLCGMSISVKEAEEKGVSPSSIDRLIRVGLEKWPTHIGACRVPECPSPKPTEVGGCQVCIGGCEPLFNKGWSLGRIVEFYKARSQKSQKAATRIMTLWDFFARDKPKASVVTTKREKIAA